MSHSTNTDTHTHTSIHSYEYMHAHSTPMVTSEILDWLDLDIHKIDQKTSRYRQKHRLSLKE
jgi:hypothetical protein